jgi:hypothetical protein
MSTAFGIDWMDKEEIYKDIRAFGERHPELQMDKIIEHVMEAVSYGLKNIAMDRNLVRYNN